MPLPNLVLALASELTAFHRAPLAPSADLTLVLEIQGRGKSAGCAYISLVVRRDQSEVKKSGITNHQPAAILAPFC